MTLLNTSTILRNLFLFNKRKIKKLTFNFKPANYESEPEVNQKALDLEGQGPTQSLVQEVPVNQLRQPIVKSLTRSEQRPSSLTLKTEVQDHPDGNKFNKVTHFKL